LTQLSEEQAEQLSNEIELGSQAKKFYESFVQPFVEEKRALIFEAFEEVEQTNLEGLAELRRMISIVNIFDYEIRSYIETGRMAQMSINETEKH
jgi:hypothetical protein